MIKYSKIALLVFASLLLVLTGCITIVLKDGDMASGLNKDTASAVMVEFAAESELSVLQVLELFSDGFTQPILGEGVELTLEDYDTIMNTMSALADMEDDVSAALIVLVPPELAARQLVYAGFILPMEYEKHLPSSPGIFGSFLDFFSFMGGAGKRSSDRIQNLTKNTPASVKNDMFNSLPSAWREGASNSDEWFAKLKNGDYDNKAAQIHKHFSISFAEDYGAEAAAQGERPIDVAAKEGAEMVKKGTQFYIDAGTTIVDAGAPGFANAISKTQEVITKVNQYEGYVKTCYKDGMGEALKQAAKDKLDEQVTGQLQNALGENFSDAVTHFTGQVMVTSKPSDLTGEIIGSGTVKVTGASNTSVEQAAVALNQDDSAGTKMVATVTNTGQPELDLPHGKYVIIASDIDGKQVNESNVTVTKGQETAIAMQPKSSDTGGDSSQIASGSQQNSGQSLLDSLKDIQDAALAGLKGDNNGDGGSSDTAVTGNQNDTGGSENAVPSPIPTPAQATGCDWNGRWKTNYAGLTLTQTGSQVTGTYGLMGETMEGTVSGNTFQGTWKNPSYSASTNTGDMELTIAADCNSFTGRWRFGSEGDWDGIWEGTRIGTVP
jgi:hypothetical protein